MTSLEHTDVGRELSSISFNQPYSGDPPPSQQREVEQAIAQEMCRNDAASRHDPNSVVIPDLFVSFISQRPKLNPHYEVIKQESEAWMAQMCHWTEKEHQKYIRADFPYFAAVWTTEAGRDEYRTICDWVIWAFELDDSFEDGNVDPENARKELEVMTNIMKSSDPGDCSAERYPLRNVFQSVWQRVEKRSHPGAQRRFTKAMEGFFLGLVGQLDSRSLDSDIETYIALRRKTIGIYPCLAMVEYVHALDIPDEVFEQHSIHEIEALVCDIILLQNDVLSYHKEQSVGATHNIVHLLRQNGLSQQEAYDKVNDLLTKRYRAWYLLHSEIPVWGEAVDVQVQMYLKGCQDIILANLNWCFRSERYFGKNNAVVRKTRMVTVLP